MIPPCYVITLKDTLGTQGEVLKKAGLDPIAFKGVNAKNQEHVYYEDSFHSFFKKFMVNGAKGCSLSHKLLCEKLYDNDIDMALILEDDAYPIGGVDMNMEIEKVLTEVPHDWDVIRLHCDSFCKDGSNRVKTSDTSTAAYLISRQGITKFKNSTITLPVDHQQNMDMKTYKTKNNLFRTDEKTSSIRGSEQSYIFEPILNFLAPIQNGEKTWHIKLNHTFMKIPYFNIDISIGDFITIVFVVIFLILLNI
jgi:GR25 family glycosyltransferase involved in LPS biosynthesis